MENKLVSIIIPIYNSEQYLDRCISSVVNQSYDNLEIILVDDGSTDSSPYLCDKWQTRDKRIRVIHKRNEGAGMARNTGIDASTGEFICFFDSDDFIDSSLVYSAYCLAIKEKADVVLFGMSACDKDGNIIRRNNPRPPKNVYRGEEVANTLLPLLLGQSLETVRKIGLSMNVCRCFFSAKMIRNSGWRFMSEREIFSEDYFFMLGIYRYLETVAVLCQDLYYQCLTEGSLSRNHSVERHKNLNNFYLACVKLCQIADYSPEVLRNCTVPYLNGMLDMMKKICLSNKPIQAIREIKKIVDNEVLQGVLEKVKGEKVNYKKSSLFFSMRHKLYFLCYLMTKAKTIKK